MKSGYPDYPKFGFIRTIWPTENWCPKSGYSNGEKIPILKHFLCYFYIFCMFALVLLPRIFISLFLYSFYTVKAVKIEERILLRNVVRMMRNIMMKMMKIMTWYNRLKLRSFKAFVTIIEISIFGFENSTLYINVCI